MQHRIGWIKVNESQQAAMVTVQHMLALLSTVKRGSARALCWPPAAAFGLISDGSLLADITRDQAQAAEPQVQVVAAVDVSWPA